MSREATDLAGVRHLAYETLGSTNAEALAAGRFRRDLDDPDLIAQVFWSGVHGVAALELTHCDDAWVEWRPVERRRALMVDALLTGLLGPGV